MADIMTNPYIFWFNTGLITIVATMAARMLRKHKTDHSLLKLANRVLLKSQILDIYNRAKERGYIGEHEIDMAEELYSVYASMDGNGYIKGVVKKIRTFNEKGGKHESESNDIGMGKESRDQSD